LDCRAAKCLKTEIQKRNNLININIKRHGAVAQLGERLVCNQ
jgi:hypothetical protein